MQAEKAKQAMYEVLKRGRTHILSGPNSNYYKMVKLYFFMDRKFDSKIVWKKYNYDL